MMAPLGLFWPEEHALLSCEDAYLFGESLLCCPVLEPNAKTRDVPLPPGEWVALFSGECVEGAQIRTCSAAPAMPVFLRAGKALVLELGHENVLGGPVSSEDAPLLTFLLAGQKGRYEFLDESGALTISWENGAYHTDGAISSPYRVLFFPAESPKFHRIKYRFSLPSIPPETHSAWAHARIFLSTNHKKRLPCSYQGRLPLRATSRVR